MRWAHPLALLAFFMAGCNLPGQSTGGIAIGGEESKTADQVIADARKDTGGFKTVHVTFSTISKDAGSISFDVSSDENGNVTGGGATGDAKFDIVIIDGKTYIKGQAFWVKVFANGGTPDPSVQALVQSKIGDHWVSGLDSLGDSTTRSGLSPPALADCLGVHGTLSKGGTQTINGKKAIEVQDKGDSPGGRAGSRFIAVDSPHVLLRQTATGPTTAGSSPTTGKCAALATPAPAPSGSPAPDAGPVTIDYGDYGKPVSVTKPTDTVDLPSLFTTQ
ncbi:MAG TPA: hypothetical protein VG329_02565 [Candidatus Dormibacteraeota bacterium]|jgi:hypothetical protein|nr:hypothetical protein [Candidatus Dormibacteraeota bacterium]